MSCFIDLALKRRCVVNVISAGNRADRAMMHVHFYEQVDGSVFAILRKLVGPTLRRLARSWFDARLWRARDIVPFV